MARSTQQQMWQEDARQHAIRQADWSRKIQASRVALRQCRARLDSAGSTFITNSLNSAQQVISQHKRSAWASEISSLLAQYAQNYIDTLQQEVQKALTGLWIQLAPLGTHVSGADTTVSVSGNPAGKVGAVLGGTVGLIWGPWGAIIGASVGGWLINSMFGTDTKQKTLDAVRQAAQGCLQVLRAEAERYLDDTVQQLEVHDKSHAPVMHPSDKTTTLLQMVEYYEKLVGWCDSFCKDVLTMKKEVQP